MNFILSSAAVLTAAAYTGDEPAAYFVLTLASIAAAFLVIRGAGKEMEDRRREDF